MSSFWDRRPRESVWPRSPARTQTRLSDILAQSRKKRAAEAARSQSTPLASSAGQATEAEYLRGVELRVVEPVVTLECPQRRAALLVAQQLQAGGLRRRFWVEREHGHVDIE